jgi:hypothetical protein
MAENTERFVSIAEAVRLTGVSRPTLSRWIKSDPALRQTPGKRGLEVWLADVADKLGGRTPDEADDELEDDLPTPAATNSRLYAELVKGLAIQNKHVENLLAPASKLTEQLSAENDRLRTRITELEGRLSEMIATHERQLSEEHSRRLLEDKEKRDAKRLDDALQALLQYAPAAVAGVAGHFGIVGVQEAVLVNAVSKLTNDQLAMLVSSGMLGPDALAILERIRATKKPNGTQTTSDHGPAPGYSPPNTPKQSAA